MLIRTKINTLVSTPIKTVIKGSGLNQKKYRWFFTNKVFQKPADFTPTLPCTFTRDGNNVIQHDMNFSQYTGGTAIYINLDSGNDATGDGSAGTPYKTISKAMQIAAAGADSAYCVKVKSNSVFMVSESWYWSAITFTNKIIALIPDNTSNQIIMTRGKRGLEYTEDGTGTWKATSAGVTVVYDLGVLDTNGIPIPYVYKTTKDECQAEIKTWYTDGTTVWIHTDDNLIPDSNFIVCSNDAQTIKLLGTSKFYMKNVMSLGTSSIGAMDVRGDATGATVVGEFIHDNCKFVGGRTDGTNGTNAFATQSVKYVYGFNSIAAYGRLDGFNYHFSEVPDANRRDCFVLEYGCKSYNHGGLSSAETNNSSTCHEGVNILRINGDYSDSRGPIVADVNACYSIIIDCVAYNSKMTAGTAYLFESSGSPSGVVGKCIIINSLHPGGDDDYDIRLSAQFSSNELYSTHFTNLNPSSAIPTYYD